jgi:chromate transport protein ChrA
MLTTAITAAITAVLSFFGIPPGPYVAGIWIGVKITIVAVVALLGWRALKKRQKREAAAPASSPDEGE